MRIAVSGTHCWGKSTLIEDFLAAHRDYVHEPEPYEWLSQLQDEPLAADPDCDDFHRQLEVSVERWRSHGPGTRVIGERSPLDFIAYLLALGDLRRDRCPRGLFDSAIELASTGMQHIDLLVVLPLDDSDGISAPESEDLELRDAMNDRLLELIAGDEHDLLGACRVIEVSGGRQQRLAALEEVLR